MPGRHFSLVSADAALSSSTAGHWAIIGLLSLSFSGLWVNRMTVDVKQFFVHLACIFLKN